MNFRLFYQGSSDLTTLTSIFLLMGSFENLSEKHWSPSEFANYNSRLENQYAELFLLFSDFGCTFLNFTLVFTEHILFMSYEFGAIIKSKCSLWVILEPTVT